MRNRVGWLFLVIWGTEVAGNSIGYGCNGGGGRQPTSGTATNAAATNTASAGTGTSASDIVNSAMAQLQQQVYQQQLAQAYARQQQMLQNAIAENQRMAFELDQARQESRRQSSLARAAARNELRSRRHAVIARKQQEQLVRPTMKDSSSVRLASIPVSERPVKLFERN